MNYSGSVGLIAGRSLGRFEESVGVGVGVGVGVFLGREGERREKGGGRREI